ncbi:unnamed protein product [Leuciscus chuanchicus]
MCRVNLRITGDRKRYGAITNMRPPQLICASCGVRPAFLQTVTQLSRHTICPMPPDRQHVCSRCPSDCARSCCTFTSTAAALTGYESITIGMGKLPQATDCSREWGSLSCVLAHTYRMWQLRALRCPGGVRS